MILPFGKDFPLGKDDEESLRFFDVRFWHKVRQVLSSFGCFT